MQALLIFIAIFLAVGYAMLIFYILKYWKKIPLWNIPSDYTPNTFISVIIPARNEETNIVDCLHSCINQDYPDSLFEIILVDDDSTDYTLKVAENIHDKKLRIIKSRGGKKEALKAGIQSARGSLIITTDADCISKKNRLSLFASFYEAKKAKFVAGPVNFHQEKNTFERFQSLDFIGMMGVTGAGIFSKKLSLSNGANLAYEKKAFEEASGFEGIDKIASGDDMLLLEKFQEIFPDDVYFLKNKAATVFTKAKPSVREFVAQRIRWAGKTAHYKNRRTPALQTWVGAFSLFIFGCPLLFPFFGAFSLKLFAFTFLFKMIVDYFFLKKITSFFERKDLMQYFFIAQVWHIAYIVLVGGGSFFIKKNIWKGRPVR